MNKTTKQAERYEAPQSKVENIRLVKAVLSASVTETPGGIGHGFEEEIDNDEN